MTEAELTEIVKERPRAGRLGIEHLVHSTALVTIGTPAYCLMEDTFDLPFNSALCAKFVGPLITYAGIGLLYSSVGSALKEKVGIDEEKNKAKNFAFETAYGSAFGAVVGAGIYGASTLAEYALTGATEMTPEKFATGTAMAAGMAAPLGFLNRFFINCYSDAFGVRDKEKQWVPDLVAKANESVKRKWALGTTAAAAIGTAAYMYGFWDVLF